MLLHERATPDLRQVGPHAFVPAQPLSRRNDVRVVLSVTGALILVAMTLFLRVWRLGEVGFNSDEAVYTGQGAALWGDATMASYFSVFRAHPLLLQLMVGAVGKFTAGSDFAARLFVAVVFGAGSVAATFGLVRRLYGAQLAWISAIVLGVLPYHIVVSRQVLVDVPMAFLVVLSLWALAAGLARQREGLVLASFIAAGAAVLAKETAILVVLVLLIVLVHRRGWDVLRRRSVWVGLGLLAVVAVAFPITRSISHSDSASNFVLWQFNRPANHSPDYFFRILLQFGGVVFLGLCVVGIVRMLYRRSDADVLVLAWLFVFFGFFQVWPTKLYPYLIVIAPALAIAVAIAIVDVVAPALTAVLLRVRRFRPTRLRQGLVVLVTACLAAFLIPVSASAVRDGPDSTRFGTGDFDIEVQSFAGGRELGRWAATTPENARFLTIGPSIGNILRYYGARDSVALSVSPDPARRNPAYVPVPNPHAVIEGMAVHYLVWDSYSADRSAFYNGRLMRYVRRFDGVPVYSVSTRDGELVESRVPPSGADVRIVVYEVYGRVATVQGNEVVDS
jgi:hypothetical protein